MQKSQSFSVEYAGRANVLSTPCDVMEAFDPKSPPATPVTPATVTAIWDTGATATAITQNVVDRLGLIATGMTKVNTAAGESVTSTYLINIRLPNRVGFAGLQVTCCVLTPGVDVLIGMDIIGSGDFAVSCHGGQTMMSFRTPASKRIDFVAEHHNDDRREQFKAHAQSLIKNRPDSKRKNKKKKK